MNNRHRLNFLNGLVDKNIYGVYCEKHKVWHNKNIECPECIHQKRILEVQKEAIKKGLFGKTNKKENISVEDKLKILKEGVEKSKRSRVVQLRKQMEDDDYRAKRNQQMKNSAKRKRLRRLAHSL